MDENTMPTGDDTNVTPVNPVEGEETVEGEEATPAEGAEAPAQGDSEESN